MRASLFAVGLALPLFAMTLPAQCANVWLPGDGWAGVNSDVLGAAMWDPDGAGPVAPVLVTVGNFTIAGSTAALGVAMWDPATGAWSAFASSPSFTPAAVAVLPNGELWVGGSASSGPRLARWDGSAWVALPNGPVTAVRALLPLPSGEVLVGGTQGIARWTGSAWASLPYVGGSVSAIATLPSGDLVVGGDFTVFGGAAADFLMRFDGVAWSGLGSGVNGGVSALMTLPSGDLVVGGGFTIAGGLVVKRIARWSGGAWSGFGAGMDGTVKALATLPGGEVVAGGLFTHSDSLLTNHIARWDGTAWAPLGSGCEGHATYQVAALAALPNGELFAGGVFVMAGGVGVSNAARWQGSGWAAMGSGSAGVVRGIARLPDGQLVVAGACTRLGDVTVDRVARWDGATWTPLGTEPSTNGQVWDVASKPNGDVVVVGDFTAFDGVAANHVASWDGSSWSPLGAGVDGQVFHVVCLANGDVVVAGSFTTAGGVAATNLARWDGSAWWPLGSGIGGTVQAMAVMPNGDLVATGTFSTAGGVVVFGVARWDGTAWSPLGSGIWAPGSNWQGTALQVLPNGDLVVAGQFTTAGGLPAKNLAVWDGAGWSPLGAGVGSGAYDFVSAMAVLANGDLAVSGSFTTAGGVSCQNLARWDGAAWSALGSGSGAGITYPAVAMTTLADGDLLLAAAWQPGPLARLSTTCPATATVSAPGCLGSSSTNHLTVAALPWLGSTFRATATGLADPSLVVAVSGLQALTPAVPLSAVFVAGAPGCELAVTPDVLEILFATGGSASSAIALPASPALVGAVFYHQMVPLELDAQFGIAAVTATNALRLVVGAF